MFCLELLQYEINLFIQRVVDLVDDLHFDDDSMVDDEDDEDDDEVGKILILNFIDFKIYTSYIYFLVSKYGNNKKSSKSIFYF